MAEKRYYVVGGEYADTSFSRLANGQEPERHGPFTEAEAMDFWRSITGRTVDNAMIRYTVRKDAGAERDLYVVGGEYADTSFNRPAPGQELEKHGPFTRQEAMDFWRNITGRTVDNAMVRYSIVSGD
jgi:hypothetical protein